MGPRVAQGPPGFNAWGAGQFAQFVGKLELTIDLDTDSVPVPHRQGSGRYNGAALDRRA